jgi:hypothetical protein
VEARSLSALVEVVLPVAWRRDSPWHGESHWRCVAATGLELAAGTEDADRALVFCFGLLHDTRRVDEAVDAGHGARAATFATELRDAGVLRLDGAPFRSLVSALRLHSGGRVSPDPTIGTCWDADRLHLPRVGIEPDPALLSTDRARAPRSLSGAERLRRDGAPGWDELVARVGATV